MSELFPEGEPRGRETPGPARPAETGGLIVSGGRRTLERLEKLLGWGPGGGWRATSLSILADKTVEVEAEEPSAGRARLRLSLRRTFRRGRAAVEETQVSVSPAACGAPLSSAAERLARAGCALLERLVEADPERRSRPAPPPEPPPDAPEAPDHRGSLVQTYGSARAWSDFFADKEVGRTFCHSFGGAVVTVIHEDIECDWTWTQSGDGTPSFYNFPSTHRRRWSAAAGSYLTSDMDDRDVIKGSTGKVDEMLAKVAAAPERPDLVVLRYTCLPTVMGEDMDGAVARFKERSTVPILYMDNMRDYHGTGYDEALGLAKAKPGFMDPPKRPGTIDLVGYPDTPEVAALERFLAALGIGVNARVLPEVDLRAMAGYMAADLQVVFDAEPYDRVFASVFRDLPLKTIRPPAPYGLEGSRRWLSAVASAMGREAAFEQAWAALAQALRPAWEALTREAASYRLGFVLDGPRAAKLRDPRRTTGIPVVDLLKEMGFGLDFLVRQEDGAGPPGPGPAGKDGRHRTFSFRTPQELEGLLRAGEACAFYSEVFYDRRLSRTGKGQFSSSSFTMGPAGAVASLRRLLAVCRLPFYRNYGAYLGRAFDGPRRGRRAA